MIEPGELSVHAVIDGTGRTRISNLRQRFPQRVTTALHSDERFPRAALLCVQSPSGGTFSDDNLRTTAVCGPGSHLLLTTQAATQVYAGDGPGATHRLQFTVVDDATLEYLPKTVIPQSDSKFDQNLEIDISPNGTYIGWEAVAAGRIAHGERFRYARSDFAVTVRSEGRVVARDRQRFAPSVAQFLDGDYVASMMVLTPGRRPVTDVVRKALAGLSGVRGGVGELPGSAGIFARLTTDRAPALRHAQQRVHAAVRDAVLPH
ncbi:urease accessory protein UreD [Mycolicibacterium brisbanense]|uniref:Urease accessory protein UreD n=1 Tax=Mycolicibacterium brisbanense TaxID=146020 RepID=A0A100VWV8_9MYCO|nr:urease accessory protein UreD [Mycolicibacterium brisbanense]MCV7161593.1 urease accessory protein UreD [Mycolicibacterium brisbanense]GAS87433.1 urease accessory protein UreD [Mycolicibacterium brisbanense]